eukprot:1364513-Rhodomonas_salina.1
MAGRVVNEGGAVNLSQDATKPTKWIVDTLTILGGPQRVSQSDDKALADILQALTHVKWPMPFKTPLPPPQLQPMDVSDQTVVIDNLAPLQDLQVEDDGSGDNDDDDDHPQPKSPAQSAKSASLHTRREKQAYNASHTVAFLPQTKKNKFKTLHEPNHSVQLLDILLQQLQAIVRRSYRSKQRARIVQAVNELQFVLTDIPLLLLN